MGLACSNAMEVCVELATCEDVEGTAVCNCQEGTEGDGFVGLDHTGCRYRKPGGRLSIGMLLASLEIPAVEMGRCRLYNENLQNRKDDICSLVHVWPGVPFQKEGGFQSDTSFPFTTVCRKTVRF